MKKIISQIGDVVTYVEVVKVDAVPGWHNVKISSSWQNARDSSEHVKFNMSMDPETFNQFKQVINEM